MGQETGQNQREYSKKISFHIKMGRSHGGAFHESQRHDIPYVTKVDRVEKPATVDDETIFTSRGRVYTRSWTCA